MSVNLIDNQPALEKLDLYIQKQQGKRDALIPVLHYAQGLFGYLPEEIQVYIAEKTGIPAAEIYGVVSFYSFFTMNKPGKNKIQICLGTACYVKGAGEILERIKKTAGVAMDGVSKDGKFSLQGARCVGACSIAPVVTVNDDIYGRVTVKQVDDILKKYK